MVDVVAGTRDGSGKGSRSVEHQVSRELLFTMIRFDYLGGKEEVMEK
jgi:hypothetical protein